MNANEVIEAIHSARYTGEKVGLQNTKALLSALQVPFTPVPAIHVAGTNGKGSVCAMLESALRAAGYQTGLYTSPFLQRYNERIRLNGRPIPDELLEKYGNQVLEAARELKVQGVHPTAFELGTALCFLAFYKEKPDIAVVEVGLGGRLDPTNVITPLASAVAAIGLDHVQFLGDTVEKIAGEKAGIFKFGVPAVVHPATGSVAKVFMDKARELRAPLTLLRKEQIRLIQADAYGSLCEFSIQGWETGPLSIPLPGAHQQGNALTAAAALKAVAQRGFPVSREALQKGLASVRWPARLEWAGKRLLIDGAHNAQGARALEDYIKTYWKGRKRVLLAGVLEEKLEEGMLRSLCAVADQVVTVTPSSPRAMKGERLAELFLANGKPAQAASSLKEGFRLADALAGEAGMVTAAGSLYLAGELRSILGLPV